MVGSNKSSCGQLIWKEMEKEFEVGEVKGLRTTALRLN
jgi:hypothetical protein